ncbi:MAG: S24 family peptidase [Candidatus Paceibacterota bacterium]|jgi:repressor LexA
MIELPIFDKVKLLSYEHPEWVDVLRACISVLKKAGGSKIAGSWVYEELRDKKSNFLPNNLRLLVRIGLLQKIGDSTRGGHRAYYTMPDIIILEKALDSLKSIPPTTVNVPLYANLASCGTPNLSDTHIDSYMEVDTQLAKPGYDYYLVRADGDSMNLEGISNGDTVLIRHQDHAEIGQKVVACLSDGVTIKELQRSSDGNIILMPRSTKSEYKPILPLASEELKIQGVVVATILSTKSI